MVDKGRVSSVLAMSLAFGLLGAACASSSTSTADAAAAFQSEDLTVDQARCMVSDLKAAGLSNDQAKDIAEATSASDLSDEEVAAALNAFVSCAFGSEVKDAGVDAKCWSEGFVKQLEDRYGSAKDVFTKLQDNEVSISEVREASQAAAAVCL